MGNKPNPALIGAFILGALALAVVSVLLFASGTFSTAEKSIIYFDGSVNGLNIGSLVKLKGVPVGKVVDILVMYDEAKGKIITPVIVEFAPEKIYDKKGKSFREARRDDFNFLISQGLRAQLQMQSLVTGQLFVDINFRPETPARLLGGEHPPYPEIPAIPSPREELELSVQEIVGMVRKMPVQQTFEALLSTIVQLEKLLKAPEIASSLSTLDHTLKEVQALVRHLDAKIDPLSDGVNGSIKEGRVLLATINQQAGPALGSAREAMQATAQTMRQAQSTLSAVEQTTAQNASLDRALQDLGSAARSLRVLADYLERQPDALLYGKSPKGD